MNTNQMTVAIVPCSGIGKTFGTVSREAAYVLCDNLRPDDTKLVALSKLVLGDSAARETITRNPVVTIDGCKQMCAAKLVKQSGGSTVREMAVLDAYRQHKDLKPAGIAELNEAGQKLAQVIAEEIAETVGKIVLPGIGKEGVPHA